ncbi:MAG: GNAT family N-acetyltransferase [Ignavibacteria bacterium]
MKSKLTAETKYELLKEISNKMRDTLELDEILNKLLDALKNVVKHDASGIFILSQDISSHPHYNFPKQHIAGIAQRGFNLPPEKDDMLTSGKGLIGHVISTGVSLVIPDVRLDSRYIPGRRQTKSEIVVPIRKNNRTIGALDVESDKIGAFNETDLEILSFFADAASISIERAMLHTQILEKEKVEKQLQIAREVQSRLLPQTSPKIKGYEFAGLCIPTYEIGGDYFDYIRIDEDNTAITVADISGDGIPAALIMTAYRALLRSHVKTYSNPSDLMQYLNNQLSDFTRKKDFVTAFYGILNTKNNTFRYTNCGHNPPLLFRANGKIELLDLHGPTLCIMEDVIFQTGKTKLNPGDQIVLYTDGVTEVFNDKREEFGLDKLIDVIRPKIKMQVSDLLHKIIEETKNFSKSEYYKDDYTLVIVKRQKTVKIVDYSSKLKKHFKDLNLEWLNKYFEVEKADEMILNNPEKYIINKGGFILFAKAEGKICGTVAVKRINDAEYEMTKMAVSEEYQGKEIGKKLAKEAIKKAVSLGAVKIVLETSLKLEKAVKLYKKLGFEEVNYDANTKTRYERPTIKMELNL